MKKDKKELLKKAGAICISIKGIKATRVEDITSRAEVAKGTFYTYFKSKEQLTNEILNEGFENYSKFIENLLGQEMSFEEKMSKIIKYRINMMDRSPRSLILINKIHKLGEIPLLAKGNQRTPSNLNNPVYKILEENLDRIDESFDGYLEEVAEIISASLFIFKDFWVNRNIGDINSEEKFNEFLEGKAKLDKEKVEKIFFNMYVKGILK